MHSRSRNQYLRERYWLGPAALPVGGRLTLRHCKGLFESRMHTAAARQRQDLRWSSVYHTEVVFLKAEACIRNNERNRKQSARVKQLQSCALTHSLTRSLLTRCHASSTRQAAPRSAGSHTSSPHLPGARVPQRQKVRRRSRPSRARSQWAQTAWTGSQGPSPARS
eukprot:3938892-Rhodomonas_salina.1